MADRSDPERTVRVVDAGPGHREAIARIYDGYVQTSPATFDIESPSAEDWRQTLAGVDAEAGRFLLAAVDGEDAVLGYAKSGPFRDRAAYASTCEVSVYVDEAHHGEGVGTALYARLLELLEASPLLLATAGMTEPNPASAALHLAFGFELVGTFADVGVKLGRPWSVTWYQRRLSP
jgi:phosphinothricin acetyltransferase